MPEEVSIIYRWTLEEYFRAFRWHRRLSGRYVMRQVLIGVLIVLAFVLGGVQYRFHAGMTWVAWLEFGGGIYLILLFGLVRYHIVRQIRRNFAKSPTRDSEIEWHVGEEGLRVVHAHGKSEFTWQALHEAVQTPDGLLLYPQPLMFHWLPKHAFVSEADYETVSRLVQSHVPAFRTAA